VQKFVFVHSKKHHQVSTHGFEEYVLSLEMLSTHINSL